MENKVNYFRQEKGWTQEQLALASGVAQATISEIEAGKHIPGVDIALCLADALGVTVNDIFIL